MPPTMEEGRNCIEIGIRHKIQELKEDLSNAKIEIIVLVLVVRPILIFGELLYPSAETSWTLDPLMILVIGPIFEEFYWRGILQERLSWIVSENIAITLTSLLFAFSHWMPGLPFDIAFLVRVCTGVFFGLAYSKTRNILVSYVAHSAVNVWGLLPLW